MKSTKKISDLEKQMRYYAVYGAAFIGQILVQTNSNPNKDPTMADAEAMVENAHRLAQLSEDLHIESDE